jgi:hypothetical protein
MGGMHFVIWPFSSVDGGWSGIGKSIFERALEICQQWPFSGFDHEQEFFAAELDGLGAANLRQPERFLLDGQLFVVERATRQGCQVIRALDGVVAVEKEWISGTHDRLC